MTRTIQDGELLLWEAYAVPGDFGFPDHSKMVFHCLTEPARRARILEREGDISEVGEELYRLSDTELLGLLQETDEVS